MKAPPSVIAPSASRPRCDGRVPAPADYDSFVSSGGLHALSFQAGLGKGSRVLIESAEKVARAGADFAICPANTAHEAFKFMRSRSPIPWLHIVEVVGDAAAGRGLSKLGILGTRFLMEGDLYREVLSERGIEAVTPATSREMIDTFIFGELVKGSLQTLLGNIFVMSWRIWRIEVVMQ